MIIGAPARVIRALEPAQVEAMGSGAKFYARERFAFQKGSEADRLRSWQSVAPVAES